MTEIRILNKAGDLLADRAMDRADEAKTFWEKVAILRRRPTPADRAWAINEAKRLDSLECN